MAKQKVVPGLWDGRYSSSLNIKCEESSVRKMEKVTLLRLLKSRQPRLSRRSQRQKLDKAKVSEKMKEKVLIL